MIYVTPIYAPITGGAASYVDFLVNSCIDKQNNITIFTEFHLNSPIITQNPKVKIFRILPVRDQIYKKTWIYNVFSYLITFFILTAVIVFCRLMLPERKLIIHGRYRNGLYKYFPIFSRSIYLDVRDNMFSTTSYMKGVNFICCSEFIKQNLVKEFSPSNIFYHPPPFDLNLLRRQISVLKTLKCSSSDLIKIVFAGGNSKFKGADLLLEFLERLETKEQRFHLTCIGRLDTEYIERIKNCKTVKEVKFIENCPHPVFLEKLSQCDIIFCASPHEGVPRVAIEAIALGIKCIVSENIMELQCIPECGNYGSANSISDLVEWISKPAIIRTIDERFDALSFCDGTRYYEFISQLP